MPKVTAAYLEEKRTYILDCTAEILKEKPLYHITMKDIIKRAGFSQGLIYQYYPNIDEIYVDYINRQMIDYPLEQKTDDLIASGRSGKEILTGCMLVLGEYIESLLDSVGGKTCFDLLITYSHDEDKRNEVLPKLKFKQSLQYAQDRIVEFTLSNVESGGFIPGIPVESIIVFAGVCIDGIVQSVATAGTTAEGKPAIDVTDLFRTLARAMVGFIE